MINELKVFLKFQLMFLLKLHIVFVLPLILLFTFSPFEVEYIEYFMIGAVLLFQVFIYNEKSYRHSIHDPCRDYLKLTNGQLASKNEISIFQNKIIYLRGVSIGLTLFSIVVTMLIFQRL